MDYKALEKILKEADAQKALQEYQKSLRRIDQNTQRAFQIIYYLNINIYLTTPKIIINRFQLKSSGTKIITKVRYYLIFFPL